MKIVIDGKEVEVPSGGVTIEQVNAAIDAKLDAVQPHEVYSTEETRIGTWIDGRPLYRKIYVGDLVYSKGGVWYTHAIEPDKTKIVHNAYGTTSVPEWNSAYVIPYAMDVSSSEYIYFGLLQIGGIILISVKGNIKFSASFEVTVEYTKTTDEATVALPALAAVIQEADQSAVHEDAYTELEHGDDTPTEEV